MANDKTEYWNGRMINKFKTAARGSLTELDEIRKFAEQAKFDTKDINAAVHAIQEGFKDLSKSIENAGVK